MSSSSLSPLVVCADDYGISPGVSRGIRELAEAGRLSATGAMTCMPHWPEAAAAWKPLAGRVAIGLHLVLTDQTPLGKMPALAPAGKLPPPAKLSRRALRGGFAPEEQREIEAELARQLDAFETHLGRKPDFIDGHHHSHQLPGMRELVLDAVAARLGPGAWLRDTSEPLPALVRHGSLEGAWVAVIGRGLHRAIRARGISANRGFTGFYRFGRERLASRIPALLANTGPRPELMVHPGHPDAELAAVDSWVGPREGEWEDLMSDEFPRALARLGFRVAQGAPFPA